MQWTGGENAGFSTAKPWMKVNPNYTEINVEDSEKRQDSLLNFYRKALAYRKDKDVFAYSREYDGKRLLVICNYKNKRVKFKLPKNISFNKANLALSNYLDSLTTPKDTVLREYEALVYELE